VKARARRYVAAGRPEWLFPERFTPPEWSQVGAVLLPRDGLFGFGGEIFIGYKDGTTGYSDAFGRRSRAHEHLQKPHAGSLQPEDRCGCGSGHAYGECCAPLPVQDRPSWTQRSIRERNPEADRCDVCHSRLCPKRDFPLSTKRTFGAHVFSSSVSVRRTHLERLACGGQGDGCESLRPRRQRRPVSLPVRGRR
jgi:hypothetical protein